MSTLFSSVPAPVFVECPRFAARSVMRATAAQLRRRAAAARAGSAAVDMSLDEDGDSPGAGLADMKRRLSRVVAHSRVVTLEDPDGGNLLVRFWEGPGWDTGRGYSTT